MLRYIVGFLVLAIILGLFGFGGAAGLSMNAAWLIAVVLIIVAVLGFFGFRTPPVE